MHVVVMLSGKPFYPLIQLSRLSWQFLNGYLPGSYQLYYLDFSLVSIYWKLLDKCVIGLISYFIVLAYFVWK